MNADIFSHSTITGLSLEYPFIFCADTRFYSVGADYIHCYGATHKNWPGEKYLRFHSNEAG